VRALATPRPLPTSRVPALAGGAAVALALPVFLAAGWRVSGWVLGAVLWVGAQSFALLLSRLRIGVSSLARSGVQGFGMMLRVAAVMVVVVAVAASDTHLALAAAGVYALGYTVELVLSLVLYFAGEAA
jgi:hypothetical protein